MGTRSAGSEGDRLAACRRVRVAVAGTGAAIEAARGNSRHPRPAAVIVPTVSTLPSSYGSQSAREARPISISTESYVKSVCEGGHVGHLAASTSLRDHRRGTKWVDLLMVL
jgi:hypothetical protein